MVFEVGLSEIIMFIAFVMGTGVWFYFHINEDGMGRLGGVYIFLVIMIIGASIGKLVEEKDIRVVDKEIKVVEKKEEKGHKQLDEKVVTHEANVKFGVTDAYIARVIEEGIYEVVADGKVYHACIASGSDEVRFLEKGVFE